MTLGLGTLTSAVFRWRRAGNSVEITGRFTAGTTDSSEMRIALPTGLTTEGATYINTLQWVGAGERNTGGSEYIGVMIEPSITYLTFSKVSGVYGGLTKRGGNQLIAAGDAFSFSTVRIPIVGWKG